MEAIRQSISPFLQAPFAKGNFNNSIGKYFLRFEIFLKKPTSLVGYRFFLLESRLYKHAGLDFPKFHGNFERNLRRSYYQQKICLQN